MKICETCNDRIENPTNRSKFCLSCSKERRKEKMREYDKNRKPENEETNKQKFNEKRRNLRQTYKEKELCIECGKDRYESLNKCLRCHEIDLKSSIKYNRKRGMLPSRTIFF